ncbi:uncharacterized mitochondrial protein-like protein [Tanacetum coccineum]
MAPRENRNREPVRRNVTVETTETKAWLFKFLQAIFEWVDGQVVDSLENDRYKTSEGYHDVPPSYTGNFMPPKYDLVLADEEEYVFNESVTSIPDVTTSEAKTSVSKPILENLIDLKVKVIRCDNGTEFKNKVMNQFCEMKGIKREFSIARTPQQSEVAKRKNNQGKFDGKADEGFFVGYSTNSKAFRIFNSRTRIVEENLHVMFSEETPNIAGNGPN